MKIICDNCGAKYSIADEKVKGKVFKIRCKKCQESIVVRGDSQESGGAAVKAPGSGGGEVETKVFDYSGYKGNEPVWYVAVDGGEQQGPYTTDQMREYLQAGNIIPDTYVWREGLEDWKLVSEIPEISGEPQGGSKAEASNAAVVAADAPTDSSAGGGLFDTGAGEAAEAGGEGLFGGGGDDAGGGLFDAGPSAPAETAGAAAGGGLFDAADNSGSPGDVFSSAPDMSTGGLFSADQNATATSKDGGGLFDGPVASGTGGDLFAATDSADDAGGIFASTEAQSSSPRVSAEAASMTGQRNENSVLFSLSNLQALASDTSDPSAEMDAGGGGMGGLGGPAMAPGGEASGLIDIRAMANSLTAEAEKADDVDEMLSLGGGGFGSTLGAPVLTAAKPAGLSLGMKIGIGAGGLILLIGIVIAAVTIAQKDNTSADEIAMLKKQIEAMRAEGATPAEIQKVQQKIDKKEEIQASTAKSGDVVPMDSKSDAGKEDKESKSRSRSGSGRSSRKKGSSSGSKGASSEKKESVSDLLADSTPKKEEAAPAPKKRKTTALDDLLGGGGGGGAAKKKKAAAPAKLSRQQVMQGMNAVAGSVKRCGAGKSGTFKIKAKIEANGRVSRAQAVGQFSGTPAGTCAANAVKRARFPQSDSSLNVTFPFKI